MILPEAGLGVIFGIADHSPAETKASNRSGTHVEELKSRATRLTASTGTATFDLKLERKGATSHRHQTSRLSVRLFR